MSPTKTRVNYKSDYRLSDGEIRSIKNKLIEEEFEKNFEIDYVADEYELREAERLQKEIANEEIARSNLPFVPDFWKNDTDQLPRDSWKLYQKGKLNLVDFQDLVVKYGILSYDDLERIIHKYLICVEVEEALHDTENAFHEYMGCR